MVNSEAEDENRAAAKAKALEEMMNAFRRLVREITDEGGDRGFETYKETVRILETIMDLRFSSKKCRLNTKKPSPLSKQDQQQIEAPPEEFLCPISGELMKDPVVLAATGETYDRLCIKNWLSSGERTCPRTNQMLSDSTLAPNNALRRMITKWCVENEITPPYYQSNENVSFPNGQRIRLNKLLDTISTSPSADDKKQAVAEIRRLTKLHSSFREMIEEIPDAIPKLLSVLNNNSEPQLQEDAVTTILNMSIHDNNKRIIANDAQAIPLLIKYLECGTMETRRNAAAAIFSLSVLDSNKEKLFRLGTMGPLVRLLDEGTPAAKMDVLTALFSLCRLAGNRAGAVEAGAVRVLLRFIREQTFVDESLPVIAMLASSEEAVHEIVELDGVSSMLRLMRENPTGRNGENAVVVLLPVCISNRRALSEVKEEESLNHTVSRVAREGTSRARRKAEGILDMITRRTRRGVTE